VPTRLTARSALIGAATVVALLLVTWFAAFHIGLVKHADRSILQGFSDLGHRDRIRSLATFVAQLCNPKPYVFFAWIPMLVALLRGRPRVALAIGVILLGANLTTQLLKPLLAVPRPVSVPGADSPVASASWPSGHATAAMSFALISVLAAPARLRPLVAALGAAFAVAVCYSFLALGWHYPSDVLGGFLIATAWTLLAVSALQAVERRRAPVRPASRPRIREALGPAAGTVMAAGVIAALVVITRPHAVLAYVRAHEAFVIGAGLIAVIALALATGLMLAVRR
jgi:membrane-associated phospholipid phosphatase